MTLLAFSFPKNPGAVKASKSWEFEVWEWGGGSWFEFSGLGLWDSALATGVSATFHGFRRLNP